MLFKVKSQFLGFGANIILCWRCEEAECNRFFDFTQHTAEQCDGKCWKSFDIIEAKTKEEREQATGIICALTRYFIKYIDILTKKETTKYKTELKN